MTGADGSRLLLVGCFAFLGRYFGSVCCLFVVIAFVVYAACNYYYEFEVAV